MCLGQVAFEAYNKDRGGVNHLGKKTPEWDELPEPIQRAWTVAARAVQMRVLATVTAKAMEETMKAESSRGDG